ncbi:MAG: MFS transporter [Rubrivivax sp.]|nr:MFS transporter [Rubrivivax sp.]
MRHEFHRLLAAEGISNFGAMLSRLAIPWLAALVLEATPLEMAALLVADVAAAAVGALLLGAWVERHGKRAVMLACDVARALVLGALAGLAWRGGLAGPWGMATLALAAAANGMLTMAFEVARSAWMAQRLAAGELVRRNAQMQTATSLSETAAFAFGGWLFQWLGAAAALVADAVSYLASALCLRGVREVPAAEERPAGASASSPGAADGAAAPAARPVAAARAMWRETTAGVAAVARHPALRALAVLEVLLALAGSLAGANYMIYVARDLAIPTGQLGVVFALGGLGALVGARLAAPAARRFGAGRTMALGLAAAALGAAFIPLAAGAGLLAIALLVAHQIVGDAGHTLFAVHDRTLRQTSVAPALLARTDAGLRGIGQAATLAGALAGGAAGNAFGARAVLAACAAVLAAAALFAAWRLRGLRGGAAAAASPDVEAGAAAG